MSKDLEYDGRPELSKTRRLEEPQVGDNLSPGIPPDDFNPVDDASTTLFTRIGRTYLKGKKLQEGLGRMEPAQFIPIADSATQVARSAERLAEEESVNGTIIPFTLYQRCINILAEKQWLVRRAYDSLDISLDPETTHQHYIESYSYSGDDLDNILSAFLTGDAIAGAILTAFAVSPSQNIGFQALTVEEGSKVLFSLQVPIGLAIVIELGLKASRVIKLLRDVNMATPELEEIANSMDTPSVRRSVLEEAGFQPDKFYKAQQGDDAVVILEYSKSYISNHRPTDPTVYDHWIAYGNVVVRNNLLRSALDTATNYSQDFSEKFDRDLPSESDGSNLIEGYVHSKPQIPISSQISSHYLALANDSDSAFDHMLNAFMYQATSDDLCCLVEIFGSMDTSVLRLMSQLLKIAAVDMQAEIALLQDSFLKLLVNAAATAVYKVIAKLDRVSNDLAVSTLEAIEDMQKELGFELEHCTSFRDVGIALTFGIDGVRSKIELMLLDTLGQIEQLGIPQKAIWHVPAERRHLLTIAKIFDVLSSKLSAAKACERTNESTEPEALVGDAKDQAAHEILHTLLDKSPPSIQITDDDIKKYFPNLAPSTSPTFGFTYGPKTLFPEAVGQRPETLNNCGVAITEEHRDRIKDVISRVVMERFSRHNG